MMYLENMKTAQQKDNDNAAWKNNVNNYLRERKNIEDRLEYSTIPAR